MPEIVKSITQYSDANGNRITGSPKKQSDIEITFKAKNCSVIVENDANLRGVKFVFNANDSSIYIGPDSQFIGMIELGISSNVKIGRNLTVTRYCYISAPEMTTVTIGDDCMFASGVEIRCDDSHPIYDLTTGARVNPSKSISIGDHVWLATQAKILGGVTIGSGSVIGHSSLVTASVPNNSIAVGTPARIVRENIVWDRSHVSKTKPHFFPHR